eukprot:363290-Chlamydomonas_euryale.AAC.2
MAERTASPRVRTRRPDRMRATGKEKKEELDFGRKQMPGTKQSQRRHARDRDTHTHTHAHSSLLSPACPPLFAKLRPLPSSPPRWYAYAYTTTACMLAHPSPTSQPPASVARLAVCQRPWNQKARQEAREREGLALENGQLPVVRLHRKVICA